MPRGIQKYRGPFGVTPGPLYNTEGDAGGGGAATKTEGDPKPKSTEGEKPDDDKGRKGGQAQILADLASERDKRQAIENQLATFQTALAAAFGLDAAGKQPSADELVADVQKQVTAMQHQSLVDRVARVHGITEADDLEFLASAKDEEQMSRFAARFKAASAPGTPKPDGSQGAKGDLNKPDPGPGVARLSAAFEDELNQ